MQRAYGHDTSISDYGPQTWNVRVSPQVADAIQEKDKQEAQLKLHRFDKLVKKKRRAWLQECLRTNNFLSRWSTDLETRKSRLEQTATTLDEVRRSHTRMQSGLVGSCGGDGSPLTRARPGDAAVVECVATVCPTIGGPSCLRAGRY